MVSNDGQKVTASTPTTAPGQNTQARAPQVPPQQHMLDAAAAARACNTSTENLAQSPEEPKEPQTRQEVIESLPKLKPIAGLEKNVDMVNLSLVPLSLVPLRAASDLAFAVLDAAAPLQNYSRHRKKNPNVELFSASWSHDRASMRHIRL